MVIGKSLGRVPLETLKQYSLAEEIANSITHGLGVLLAIIGLTVLVVLASLFGTGYHLASYLIYGISVLLLYTSSTLYHALPSLNAKRIFKICDHAAIFLLIAGSYTPFMLINIKGKFGWTMIVVVWSLALTGIVFKLFFSGKFKFLSTLFYLGMGWLSLIAIKPLMASLTPEGMKWLIAGGLTYTVGTVFYLLKRIPFTHAIWHVFVLLGSIFHYLAIINSMNLHRS